MQLIASNHRPSPRQRIAVARSLAVALLLLAAGVALAFLSVGTPLVSGLVPYGRTNPLQVAGGVAVWGFAIVFPAAFVLMGIARLATVVDTMTSARSPRMTAHLESALGADHLAATGLVLPGGRRLHGFVLGPFGIVVLGALPPPRISRHIGSAWEIRDSGRWIPIEDPVMRASRDAERVRTWLTSDERDFLVKVYAAVVTDDEQVDRSPTCAVVKPAELRSWLETLPAQRGLTEARRDHLVELIGSIAGR